MNIPELPKLSVFSPIYNEMKSRDNIRANLKRLMRYFPAVKMYFSDNCSTDGTWEFLQALKAEYPGHVFASKNETNIGFSPNLLNACQIADDNFVLLLGANDRLSSYGLWLLRKTIAERPHLDFMICNWAYLGGKTGKEIVGYGDISKRLEAKTLEEAIRLVPFTPIGIMQYVAKPKVLKNLVPHVGISSPQIGAFLDAFPCNFMTLGFRPLAYVNHVESDGWRKSAESILLSHLRLVRENIQQFDRIYPKGNLSPHTYGSLKRRYLKVLPAILIDQFTFGAWGKFSSKEESTLMFVAKYVRLTFQEYRKNGLEYLPILLFHVIKIVVRRLVVLFVRKPVYLFKQRRFSRENWGEAQYKLN